MEPMAPAYPNPAPDDDAAHEETLRRILSTLDEQQLHELIQLSEEAVQEQAMSPRDQRSRFAALATKLAAHGAHDPDALAAYIGRKKYGKAGMAALAAAHRAVGDPGEARFNTMHAEAGSANGGQFVSKGGGGSGSSKGKGKSSDPPPETEVGPGHGHGHGHHKPHGKHVHIPKGSFGFDPASNHGTGYGSKNGDPHVHDLQRELNRLGFTDAHGKKLTDDGKLGPLTTAAVVKAKQQLGIKPADGIVDPAFIAKLKSVKTPAKKHIVAPSKHSLKARRSMSFCTRAFDFEFDGDSGDGRTLEGYAAVFNAPTRIRDLQGDFDEVVLPGAFQRSISKRMPVLQFDHGKDPRIGSTPIGTIEDLSEDSRGLYVRAQLFTHPDVERVREAIAGKAIRGMSFRFGVPKGGDRWSQRNGDVDLRELRDTDVHELGPVVFPAYDQTSVSVRSILAGLSADEMRELIHELQHHFRLAVDLEDLTGRSDAWSADGGDPTDVEPDDWATRNSPEPEPAIERPALPSLTPDQRRLQERALRAIGVL